MSVLITGISGFLGYALRRCLDTESNKGVVEPVATWYARRPPAINGRLVRVDLADQKAVFAMLAAVQPQAVIHLAAISQPNACETDGPGTAAVDVVATAALARWCAAHDCPMVFTSTDLVFDGTTPPYDITDLPTPLNAYARQKVAAETAIRAHHPRAVICRLPLMFGYGGTDYVGFAQEMVVAIARKDQIRLFRDEFRTPLYTRCAAKALLAAVDWPGGIYHLGGPERISRFEFGRRIAAQLGVGDAHLLPLRQTELPMAAQRPRDVSLDSHRAYALGFKPLDLDAAIRQMLIDFGRFPFDDEKGRRPGEAHAVGD